MGFNSGFKGLKFILDEDSINIEHLLFDCTVLQEERERLIGKISKHDNWPVNKSELGNKYIRHFTQFTNSIDFTQL